MLVEREDALAQLRAAAAGLPPGRCALVAGEAGSGKSSLLRAFLPELTGTVLLGHCDSLGTARPYGPLLDWTGGEVPTVAGLVALMRSARVAVVEDAHWIDDASLGLLAQLVRRHDAWPGLLVLSYREDEVGPAHPLTALLGEIAARSPVRVATPALTTAGITALAAGSGLPVQDLHDLTGGNAFFVTECLAGGSLELSANVRDVVLARAAHRPASERAVLEAVAVVPGRCELWLANALGAAADDVDAALSSGLLRVGEDGTVELRHELARLALLDALPPGRRRSLHAQAAHALAAVTVVDHARVVHHAVHAGLSAMVAEHAGLAAAAAEAAGARSQALAHLTLAVQHTPTTELLSRLAEQQDLAGRHDEAIETYRRALASTDDRETRGALLSRLPGPLSMSGRLAEAEQVTLEAVRLIEQGPPSPTLAYAYAQMCSQHMLARELDAAVTWGEKARALGAKLGDHESETYAALQGGVAQWMSGAPDGLELLRLGIRSARAHGLDNLVALGLLQIGSGGGEIREYGEAIPALEQGVAWAEQHELESREQYALAWLGRCQVETGRWDDAAATISRLLRDVPPGISRLTALTALGRLRTRRGDPDAAEVLDQALEMALPTGQLQRLWPVVAARAEAAWLVGELPREVPRLQQIHSLARDLRYPWARDELAFWLSRAGLEERPTGGTPYALHAVGRFAEAAERWAALGCPYEQADALADSPEEQHQLDALSIHDALGAAPAHRRLAEQRRAWGLPVPRGPNALTKGNPAGLTDRELDVLREVAHGLTNAQIAATLHISAKTVGHHVGHVLAKLGARSRAEAVSRAVDLDVPLSKR